MVRLIRIWIEAAKRKQVYEMEWVEELIWREKQHSQTGPSSSSTGSPAALPESATDPAWGSLETRTLPDVIEAFISRSSANSLKELSKQLKNIAYKSGLMPAPSQQSPELSKTLKMSFNELTRHVLILDSEPNAMIGLIVEGETWILGPPSDRVLTNVELMREKEEDSQKWKNFRERSRSLRRRA